MLGIDTAEVSSHRAPWNKGRLIGQKRRLKPKEVWAIRVRLQLEARRRDLALFNLALPSCGSRSATCASGAESGTAPR